MVSPLAWWLARPSVVTRDKIRRQAAIRLGIDDEYHVFISYSRFDRRWALALSRRFQRLGRGWRRRPPVRVFVDRTEPTASGEITPSVRAGLSRSRSLVLLASPASARSEWIRQELRYWRSSRSRRAVLIAYTGGALPGGGPDGAVNEEALRDLFAEEAADAPAWVDLATFQPFQWWRPATWRSRWKFADRVAALAAPVLDIPKAELYGEERRRQRRVLQAAAAAVVTVLVVGALVPVLLARQQRERHLALATTLAKGADDRQARPDLSLLLSAAAYRAAPEAAPADLPTKRAMQYAGLRRILPMPADVRVGPVRSVAVSPDGNWIGATASLTTSAGRSTGGYLLWPDAVAADLGQPPTVTPIRDTLATKLAFSPDNRSVAVGARNGQVEVRSLASVRAPIVLVRTKPAKPVIGLSFSGQGRRLAVAYGDGSVAIWDVAHRRIVAVLERAVAGVFGPDGRTLAAVDTTGVVALRDAVSYQVIRVFSSALKIRAIAFSPDGRRLAALPVGGGVVVLDPATGRYRVVPTAARSAALAYGPNDLVATDSLVITGAATARPAVTGRGWPLSTTAVTLAPDGRTLLTAGRWNERPGSGAVLRWDATPGPLAESVLSRSGAHPVLRPDGRTVGVVLPDGTVGQRAPRTGVAIGPPLTGPRFPDRLAYGPDNHLLAAVRGGRLTIWNLIDGRSRTHTFPVRRLPRTASTEAPGLEFAASGRLLATITPGGNLVLVDPRTASPVGSIVDQRVSGVAFSADGRTVAVATVRGVRLWDVGHRRARRLLTLPRGGRATAVTFVGRSSTVLGTDGRTVVRWDAATGRARPLALVPLPAGATLTHLSADPGARFVIGATTAGGVYGWDLATGASWNPQAGGATVGTGPVTSLAVADDGKSLLIGVGADRLVRWNLDPGYWRKWACDAVGRDLTVAEWHRYASGRPLRTCD